MQPEPKVGFSNPMPDSVISVRSLGKEFAIGARQERYRTFRDTLVAGALAPIRRLSGVLRGRSAAASGLDQRFWALQDVSFDVPRGKVVGIIGRNGAGKSTLLKILSRITEPTTGSVDLYGRVGSLLEVGTGFHPELTGRENIYLNGAILGMRRREIERDLDEIVAFAEIDNFLDTPVKHYSSGMYVRLAFAVAAHLETEILLVDEVLAVGDAAFQKKCLGKMSEIAGGGRTILFVSHNMAAVRNLCHHTFWIHQGRLHQTGETGAVTEAYLRQSQRAETIDEIQAAVDKLPDDPAVKVLKISVEQNGQPVNTILNDAPVEICVTYQVLQKTTGLRIYFDLIDDDQSILVRSFHDEDATAIPTMYPGTYTSKAVLPSHLLAPRAYEIRIRASIYNVRTCTGEGVGIPIFVEAARSINSAYANDPIRSKLQPEVTWQTTQDGK